MPLLGGCCASDTQGGPQQLIIQSLEPTQSAKVTCQSTVLQYYEILFVLCQLVAAVLLLVLSPWLPESPRYHVVKGHMAKAQKVLQHVARWNGVKLPRGTLHRGHGHATPRATATAGGGDGVAVIDVDVNVDVDEEDFRGKVVVIIIIILKWGYNAAAICGGKD